MPRQSYLARTILLFRLLLGGTRFMATAEPKERKLPAKIGIGIGATLLFGYMIAIVAVMSYGLTGVLLTLGLAELMPRLLLSANAMMVFVFGIYYVISIFYYSAENTVLLALPFRPSELVGAKFLQTLLYEYVLTGMIFLPALITYGVVLGEGVAYYVLMVLVLLLSPVIPLAITTLVILLVMRVVPFAKNKDRVATIMNVVMLAVIIGISFLTSRPMSESQLADLIVGGDGSLGLASASRLTLIFPGYELGIGALTNQSFLQFAMFMLANAGFVALLLYVGSKIYAKTILSFSDGSGKRVLINRDQLKRESRSQSAFFALALKESRLLLRTPAYLMNNVLSAFIMPLFVVIMPLFYGQDLDGETLGELGKTVGQALADWWNPSAELRMPVIIGLAVLLGYMLTFGNLNTIASTAVSRDGPNAFVMKYIPQSYRVQFLAKLVPAVVVALLPNLIILVVLRIIVPLPLSILLVSLLLILLAVALTCVSGLVFDVWSPKLKWESETQAVKNNMNSIFTMLFGFVLLVIPIGPAVLAWKLQWTPALYLLLVIALMLAATVGVGLYLDRLIPKRLESLDL